MFLDFFVILPKKKIRRVQKVPREMIRRIYTVDELLLRRMISDSIKSATHKSFRTSLKKKVRENRQKTT